MTIPDFAASFFQMSAAEIIKELPRLSEAERRAIREVLLEIANRNPDVASCNEFADAGGQLLGHMENEDGSAAA